jgi:hypothetical protein
VPNASHRARPQCSWHQTGRLPGPDAAAEIDVAPKSTFGWATPQSRFDALDHSLDGTFARGQPLKFI